MALSKKDCNTLRYSLNNADEDHNTIIKTMSLLADEFDVTMTREALAKRILLLCFGMCPQKDTEEYDQVLIYIDRLCLEGAVTVNGAWYSVDWTVLDILVP